VKSLLNRGTQPPCTRTLFAPTRMNVVAISGSVPGQFVSAGSEANRATATARSRIASCVAVSYVRPAVTGPELCITRSVAIDTVYGRMFPPSRPKPKPLCGEAPAAGTNASSRTTAGRNRLLIRRKRSDEPLA
jgi:hypothetical protein